MTFTSPHYGQGNLDELVVNTDALSGGSASVAQLVAGDSLTKENVDAYWTDLKARKTGEEQSSGPQPKAPPITAQDIGSGNFAERPDMRQAGRAIACLKQHIALFRRALGIAFEKLARFFKWPGFGALGCVAQIGHFVLSLHEARPGAALTR